MVNPKTISTVLSNVVAVMKEKTVAKDAPRQALVRYQVDDATGKGQVTVVGCGRWAGGLDWCEVEGATPGYAEVTVLATNPAKTDIVDDLAKLSTAIRGTSTAQSALVRVTMLHGYSITVEYGDELLGELGDQGDQHKPVFDRLEDEIDGLADASAHTGPVAFHIDVIGRLSNVKGAGKPAEWGVVDMVQHPTLPVAGVKIGPTFRALLGEMDRDGYAATGAEQAAVLF